ncbi:autotransporter outer membrane beta-barrel domain-containing protein [Pararobbsia silviterrae]|uniref:Autotransporter outer membrane beta-barrel domain-containing protein n=1 Tax=Pararobbsia silviterrae TaxID=1792498 RepID=A0A494XQ00_9BURK|nr:autotransporter outer membrane beta-barrel domain-containing protein [Pararobbsia silviterrae]RKP49613.1 autotransporter outer membrane beta-barrel domain-containing protein [Pararobbsia silviterrae]
MDSTTAYEARASRRSPRRLRLPRRTVISAAVSVATLTGVSSAFAVDCASTGAVATGFEYTNATTTSCDVPASTQVARITDSATGPIVANGVTILVPYGNAVTSTGGGTISIGVDSVTGASSLAELYTGSGGLIGLWATGAGSHVDATDFTITMPGSGNIVAEASAGGVIMLDETNISIAQGGGSQTLYATGTGSQIIADTTTITGSTGGGDYGIHADQGAEILFTNSDLTLTSTGGGITGALAENGSTFEATNSTINLTATGGDAAVKSTSGSTVILNGGSVTMNGQGGDVAVAAQAAVLSATDVVIKLNAAGSNAGDVQNGGTMTITGGSVTATGASSIGFLVDGNAGVLNTLSLADTTVSSTADSFRVTGADASINLTGTTVTDNNGILLTTSQPSTTTFDASASTLSGVITTGTGSTNDVTLADATTWTMTGSSNATTLANNASSIVMTAPTGSADLLASYKTLTVQDYSGASGNITLNTFLGTDGAPSDMLVIDGGAASGSTALTIHNTTGPGAETVGNGILVVDAVSGGTTAADAFSLSGRVREGAFDYRLFRGGVDGTDPEDWFLRSSFETGGSGGGGGSTGGGGGGSTGGGGGAEEGGGGTDPGDIPDEEEDLPVVRPGGSRPGVDEPIIGPEIATYGVVQPIARQMGLMTIGTLHERIGDTLADPLAAVGDAQAQGQSQTDQQDKPWLKSSWGRVFGQQIDNQYEQFSDPRATGQIIGVQAGVDIWHGSLAEGHHDVAGAYFAYGNAQADVNGYVTNAAATGYVATQTGSMHLDAYSGGLYWTHYGPTGWYLDAVLQGTYYNGDASSTSTTLPVSGNGVATSLEAGYPIPLPLGPGFVLEPQAQIIWQRVNFSTSSDAYGSVDLGTTTGATGRVGVRGRWTIDEDDGRIWQPYARVNLWHDWAGNADTMFDIDSVPLLQDATRLEFAGGLTVKFGTRFDLYMQAGYQYAVGATDGGRRQGVQGDLGARYSW